MTSTEKQIAALDKIKAKLNLTTTTKIKSAASGVSDAVYSTNYNKGYKSELNLQQIIKNQNYSVTTTAKKGIFSDFDLEFISKGNQNYKIEVKSDFSVEKTGNIAIELFTGTGKESGINITKAPYFIYCIAKEFYLFRTELLKLLIQKDSKNYRTTTVHDSKNTIALFKKDYLLNYSIKLNPSEDITKQLELTNLQLQKIIVKFNNNIN